MKNWPLLLFVAMFVAGMIYFAVIAQPPQF